MRGLSSSSPRPKKLSLSAAVSFLRPQPVLDQGRGGFGHALCLASCRALVWDTFQRRPLDGSAHSNRALAFPTFDGCSFLLDGRAERHSAVERSPRSHSSASLRSKSAIALSAVARAGLRYRIARRCSWASQIPTQHSEASIRCRASRAVSNVIQRHLSLSNVICV